MAGFGTIVLPVDENAASSGIARMERVYQVIYPDQCDLQGTN